MTKLLAVARFEIGYRLGRPGTWVFALLLMAVPVLMMQAIADAPRPVNSPMNIAGAMTLMSIAGMLAWAAIFGDAATRDIEQGTEPLFYTLPLTELEYLGGRFLGAFVVSVVLLLLGIAGLLIGLVIPYGVEATFGPMIPGAYVEGFLTILLPNLFFTSAVLFAVACLARSTMPAYLSAVALFGGYLVAIDWQARLTDRRLATLLDPFGAIVIQQLTNYLPQAEQDTARLGLPPTLLANRLAWIAVGVGILLLLARRFRFATAGRSWLWRLRRAPAAPAPSAPEVLAGIAPPTVHRSFDGGTAIRQTMSVARSSLRNILSGRIFALVLFAGVVLVFAFGWDVGAIVFDTSTWPVTHLIASLMRGPAALAVVVLIAVYSGELVWADRDRGIAAIVDSMPAPTWVLLAGKFIALVGMIVVFQIVLMFAGMLLQTVQGYHHYEIGVYAKVMFGFLFATYLLFSVLAIAVHSVLNNKHFGHFVVVMFFVFYLFSIELGVRHNLLRYGADPGWVYSDLNGFGPFVGPFLWFKAYWSAWALLLAVIAALFWVRGSESGWRARLPRVRQRLNRRTIGAAALAVVLIASLGGFIFYNTNVLNDYSSATERSDAAAEYERRYRRYENTPIPVVHAADLRVEVYPERGEADLRGTYRTVNGTSQRITSVHVATSELIEVDSQAFDRPARLVVDDRTRHQYRIYELERPLEPGDSLRLAFAYAFRRHGFPNSGINTAITRNGAYFDRAWLPRIGYQSQWELDDASDRRVRGLAPPRPMRGQDDTSGTRYRYENRDADVVDVDAVIGTSADQIAVTTGRLVRDWEENGRRYFQYHTDAPLMFAVPVLSARYAVREDKWNDVTLKVFYHPTHVFNVDRMIRSMKASLDYYTHAFGPYQFKELRIVEFPRYATFARAHPHTIAFSEGGAFLTRINEGEVDRPYFVVAHETAHQWWGGQISPARVRGAALLSETLAQYGSIMVLEKTYGRDHARRFLGFEMDRYLRGRSLFGIAEAPLLDVEEQSYLYYSKGGLAMYSLKEHIGEERVNAALRSYLAKWRDAGPPYPTARDVYKELQAVTPDSMKSLLTDFFETITLWNLRVTAATAERMAPNSYRVTLDVEVKKVRSDSVGRETETPMNDLVDIGIFAAGDGKDVGEPLYSQKHRLRSGTQQIVVTVSKQPGRVGVDPYQLLIQRDRERKVIVPLSEVRVPGDTTRWRAEYRTPKSTGGVKLKVPQF